MWCGFGRRGVVFTLYKSSVFRTDSGKARHLAEMLGRAFLSGGEVGCPPRRFLRPAGRREPAVGSWDALLERPSASSPARGVLGTELQVVLLLMQGDPSPSPSGFKVPLPKPNIKC